MMFLDSPATPEEFVEACRRYKGIRHSMLSSFVVDDETPRGWLSCRGLVLAALRRVGLLPVDFDLNVSDAQCFSMLRANFYRVATGVMRSGDLIFLDINGPEPLEHIAVYIEAGRIIHALNDERGIGKVYEQGLTMPVKSVYRLNIFAGVDFSG